MNLLRKLLSKPELKLEPVVENALDGVMAEIYNELGLGVYSPTLGSPDKILEHLGAIKAGIRRYKNSYVATRVMELVREGKKVPSWLQRALDKEIELGKSTGEPEDIKP